MEKVSIEKPGAEDEGVVQAFLDSFIAAGESVVNGSAGLDMDRDYQKWQAYLARIEAGAPDVFLPSLVYIAKTADGQVAGILDIRPGLPQGKEHFGHIGYAVAPPFRRRGVAAQMVAFGTKILEDAGVDPAIACCYADNLASIATLEGCGYKRNGFYTEQDDKIVLIFHKGQGSEDLPMVSNGH